MTNIISTNEFLEELNNTYFKDEDDCKVCHINLLPFDENAITLPCKHKFNYVPLLNYIYSIKRIHHRYNTIHLKSNELQCPMCRTISKQLLPFIPCENTDTRMHGITSPAKYCMPHKICSKVLRRGKNKGKICGKPGYHTCNGNMCEMHDKSFKKTTQHSAEIIETIGKQHTIKDLKAILKANYLMVSGTKTVLIDRLLTNKIIISM